MTTTIIIGFIAVLFGFIILFIWGKNQIKRFEDISYERHKEFQETYYETYADDSKKMDMILYRINKIEQQIKPKQPHVITVEVELDSTQFQKDLKKLKKQWNTLQGGQVQSL